MPRTHQLLTGRQLIHGKTNKAGLMRAKCYCWSGPKQVHGDIANCRRPTEIRASYSLGLYSKLLERIACKSLDINT